MEIKTNDLILRTMTENDIEEIARMWEYPHETTISENKIYPRTGDTQTVYLKT